MLDPGLIGKVDYASKEVKEKEQREAKEAERLERFRNRKKKNTRKLKDHIAKDVFRDQLRREHVTQDKQLRKQLYDAERRKEEGEREVLGQNLGEIVQMSRVFLKGKEQRKGARDSDSE